MGRTLTFDKDDALDTCLSAFWKAGFDNTSVRDLQRLTGLSGRSLIHSFGDKRGIFELCLNRYLSYVKMTTARFSSKTRGLESFFESFTKSNATDLRHHGCFILNSISGSLKNDQNLIEAFTKFEQVLTDFFTAQLEYKKIQEPQDKAMIVFDLFLAGLNKVAIYGDSRKMISQYQIIKRLITTWGGPVLRS